jgi:aryl-alcohol dehydrogenase-like predicted oxidoreductase
MNTTFALGGDLEVHRLGFGAMQLTGPGVWGEPEDRPACVAVLRKAVELGVDFIDTADSYGPAVSEEIIREALHPYDGVVVATKAGLARTGPGHWHVIGLPEYLTQCAEMSLRRLGVERIDLFQLHRIDLRVPLAEQLGALTDLQAAGKIRHIGLSEVTVDQLLEAQRHAEIVSVQNLYNLSDRRADPLVEHCTKHGVAFIPWFPFANGDLARPGGPLDTVAAEIGCTPAQAALAWLLRRSPGMLPIPGTKSIGHLQENCSAAAIRLSDAQYLALDALGR